MYERFLIIDDSPAVRAVMKEILTMRGVSEEDMRFVSRGDEAMDAFHEFEPDLVFLDINMPGMQGEKVAEAMLTEQPLAKIIGVTGLRPTHDQVTEMVSHGVFKVVHKPVRKQAVDQVFRELEEQASGFGRIM